MVVYWPCVVHTEYMAQISKFCQNGRYRIGKQTLGMVPVDDHFWPIHAPGAE
jgi:hypothetical protein